MSKEAKTISAATRPAPEFLWSELIHLGMNQWHELAMQQKWPNVTDPVIAKAIAEAFNAADHVRFDEAVWGRVCVRLKEAGVNQIVIDLGEAVVYPSHPELAVKGSWSPGKLRDGCQPGDGAARRLRRFADADHGGVGRREQGIAAEDSRAVRRWPHTRAPLTRRRISEMPRAKTPRKADGT